jgi:hypothetical protein
MSRISTERLYVVVRSLHGPTETEVESGTSQSKSGTSDNLRSNSGVLLPALLATNPHGRTKSSILMSRFYLDRHPFSGGLQR